MIFQLLYILDQGRILLIKYIDQVFVYIDQHYILFVDFSITATTIEPLLHAFPQHLLAHSPLHLLFFVLPD